MLVTGDSGLRIQAQSRTIDVYKPSDDDLLPRYEQAPAATGADPYLKHSWRRPMRYGNGIPAAS
jgi:hypothetical protein